MLNDTIKNDVKKAFNDLADPIKIVYNENVKAQFNNEIKDLLSQVVELDDKLSLEIKPSEEENTPYFDIQGKNKGVIRFMGIPGGHEFSTLISSILMASTGNHQLSEESVKYFENLTSEVDLKVFVTPTCPHCPSAVFLAHRFAMISEKVTASMVEAMEFQEMSQKFSVSGVPHTIVNDELGGFVGAHPEPSALTEIKKVLEK